MSVFIRTAVRSIVFGVLQHRAETEIERPLSA
jgi:hypothetical protein